MPIIPTDNAVIDYSIVSQMITAINDLQTEVSALKSKSEIKIDNGDGTTKTVAYKVDGGTEAIKNSTVVVKPNLTSVKSIVATVYNSGGATAYAHLSSGKGGSWTFKIVKSSKAELPSTAKLYWMAIGS